METVPEGTMVRKSVGGSLLAFLALTYAATWTCFLLAVRSGGLGVDGVPRRGIGALILLGTIMPSLVALGLTATAEGASGVRGLLGRLFDLRLRSRWLLFAGFYMIAIKLGAAILHRLILGRWPAFGREAWYVMIAATAVSMWVQAGEEVGWRGYALPRLAARLGFGTASIVLGVIWATWHLPLFYLPGADTFGQSFVVYLLQVIAISVAMAWLFWRTGGRLLPIMLMHAAINNTKDIVPATLRAPTNPWVVGASPASWLALALMWVVAGYLLVRMRSAEALEF